MGGFHTITFGCKLNQFDSAAIEGELARRGFVHEADAARAAIVILNTCTVTHRADADARKHVRRIRRENPECTLLVTGCYAERDARAVAAIEGVDRVFGNRDKPRLPALLDELGLHRGAERSDRASPISVVGGGDGVGGVGGDRGCDALLRRGYGGQGAGLPRALHFGRRSRAFLKVQDGCRLACAYCIIPAVRGPSRSVAPAAIERAARTLVADGYREIVLTGINTGDYGRELDPATDLTALLERLLPAVAPARLRLNSLEPLTVTEPLVALMAREPRLAPHLQVPLQSGSDTVLRGMRRNYRAADWLDRARLLRREVPDVCIGADVIVGFPGETGALFDETVRFLEDAPLDYLHVFSWSPRPGTPAAERGGRVPEAVIGERSARLRAFSEQRKRAFRRRFVGRALEAVVLETAGEPPRTRALTGNYIEVALPAGAGVKGRPLSVRIERVDGNAVTARPAGRAT